MSDLVKQLPEGKFEAFHVGNETEEDRIKKKMHGQNQVDEPRAMIDPRNRGLSYQLTDEKISKWMKQFEEPGE